MPTTVSEASALLERAARDRGLVVQRVDPEIVTCSKGSQRVVFHGWCGGQSPKVAHELCDNIPWLRGHLASRGLPVVPTAWVDHDDVGRALTATQMLGLPVSLVAVDPQGHRHEGVAGDPAEFRQVWQRVVAEARASSAYVQHPPEPVVRDLVVVCGEVVAGSGGSEVDRLARQAVEAVPGLRYAAVRLVGTTEGAAGLRVDRVDPAMLWPADLSGDVALVVVNAVLDAEFVALT